MLCAFVFRKRIEYFYLPLISPSFRDNLCIWPFSFHTSRIDFRLSVEVVWTCGQPPSNVDLNSQS